MAFCVHSDDSLFVDEVRNTRLPKPGDGWQRQPEHSAGELLLLAKHVGLHVHRGELRL